MLLPDLPASLDLAGRRVELRHRMDGRLAVVYQGQVRCLLQPAQLVPPCLEQFDPAPQHLAPQTTKALDISQTPTNGTGSKPLKSPAKPDYNHPWRQQGRAAYRQRQQLKEQNLQEDS